MVDSRQNWNKESTRKTWSVFLYKKARSFSKNDEDIFKGHNNIVKWAPQLGQIWDKLNDIKNNDNNRYWLYE